MELPQSADAEESCRECWAKTFPKKTFTVQLQPVMSVLGGMVYDKAPNNNVLQVLNRIENFGDVRMICLTPLAKYNPLNHKTETKKDGKTGGFVGLLPHKKVKHQS